MTATAAPGYPHGFAFGWDGSMWFTSTGDVGIMRSTLRQSDDPDIDAARVVRGMAVWRSDGPDCCALELLHGSFGQDPFGGITWEQLGGRSDSEIAAVIHQEWLRSDIVGDALADLIYAIRANSAAGFAMLPAPAPASSPARALAPTAARGSLSVKITAPKAGTTITGGFTFSASVTSDNPVTRVRFYGNNVLIRDDTLAPYACGASVKTLPKGSVVLRAVAVDDHGSEAEASIIVSNP